MATGTSAKEGYLTGKLLVAMPQLSDTRFHKAVIFICAHDENGAMGLVVNHILPGLELPSLLDQLAIDGHAPNADMPVMSGGPVETARGFILHKGSFQQIESLEIESNIYVTGTIEALKAVARGEGPEKMLFILGYAGWTAGQLDHELQDNAWLVTDADPAVIFEGDPEERWDRAIKKIGINPSMLSGSAGRA
ncbi:MAG: YqgE/AlgH family protein [Alphaproteobacteria bacterium]|nr:YqgE/AlgH family protein [Alphaproteobacteria bacterium]